MDRFTASNLRAYYGAMLTERQNEFLKLHYDEDLSFGEIAEMFLVSRQAVSDAIKTGEKTLSGFEDKLGIAAREGELISALKAAKTAADCGNIAAVADQINAALNLLEE